ncbi:hypothetical protein BKA69DRAFT_624104 [Paraphysoderma sedebokerense]|nr:hypothetical protein BKA69DRAFT_624104 [Paraphysoderma sedebokerense]
MMTSAVKTRRQTKPIKVELKPKPTKQSCIGSLIFSATVASTSPFGFFYLPSSGKNNSRKPPLNHPPPPKHSSSPQLSSSSPSDSNPSSPNKSKPPSNVAHRNPKSPIQALGLGPKLPTRQRIFSSFSSSHKTKQARTASAFIQKTAVLEVENIVDSEGTSPKESTARSNHNVKQASEPILSNTRFSETESQNSTINSPVNAVANGSIGGMVRVSTGSPNDNGEGTGNTSTLGSMASGLNMSNENIKRRIYSAPVRPPPPKSLPKGMQKISESGKF